MAALAGSLLTGIGGGLLSGLLGRKKVSFTPISAIPLTYQTTPDLPNDPNRQIYSGETLTNVNTINPVYRGQITNLPGTLNTANNNLADAYGKISGYAAGLTNQISRNPVPQYFGDFARRMSEFNANNQKINDAAFSQYGSQGSSALANINALISNQGARGISNSSVSRDQINRERNQLAALQAESAGKLQNDAYKNIQGYGGLVNDALRNNMTGYSALGQFGGQLVDAAQAPAKLNLQAIDTLGNQTLNQSKFGSDLEKQARDEVIARNNLNTQIKNQEALNNVQNQRDVQMYNSAGGDRAKNSSISFGQAFLNGFGSFAGMGSGLFSGGGSSSRSSGGSSGGYTPYGSSSYGSGDYSTHDSHGY